MSIGPVERELLHDHLRAVADEMAVTLRRSAHSMAVRDHLDFSTAVFDRDGAAVAQGSCLAMQLGALPFAVRGLLAAFPDGIPEDRVAVTNDPYSGAGTHLPDLIAVAPVLHEGERVAYVATLAHKVDIGGRTAGGLATDSNEIFEEGLRIPPLLLPLDAESDDPGWMVFRRIVEANVRLPEPVIGDLLGQLATLYVGRGRFADCISWFGIETVVEGMAAILDYSESFARQRLAELPDARTEFTDYLDDDGSGGGSLELPVAVEVAGDTLRIDYTKLPDQVPSAINATFPNSYTVALFALRAVVGDGAPVNDGFARALTVDVRQGSIANANFPAAVGSRGILQYRLWDALMGAIGEMLPERGMAGGDGGNDILIFSGRDGDEPFVMMELLNGSWGGRPFADGIDGTSHPLANLSNTPIEHIEREYPIAIEDYSLVPDSGGPGLFRGGCGVRRVFRIDCERAVMQMRSSRRSFLSYGLDEGEPGAASSTELVRDGERTPLPCNGRVELRAGDRIVHVVCGAGGFGEPAGRDRARLRDDLSEGYVSGERAFTDYSYLANEEGLVPKKGVVR